MLNRYLRMPLLGFAVLLATALGAQAQTTAPRVQSANMTLRIEGALRSGFRRINGALRQYRDGRGPAAIDLIQPQVRATDLRQEIVGDSDVHQRVPNAR